MLTRRDQAPTPACLLPCAACQVLSAKLLQLLRRYASAFWKPVHIVWGQSTASVEDKSVHGTYAWVQCRYQTHRPCSTAEGGVVFGPPPEVPNTTGHSNVQAHVGDVGGQSSRKSSGHIFSTESENSENAFAHPLTKTREATSPLQGSINGPTSLAIPKGGGNQVPLVCRSACRKKNSPRKIVVFANILLRPVT